MHRRTRLSIIGLAVALAGCGGDADGPRAGSFVADQRIIYSDGLHNENTEMIRLGDRILLIFRGGEDGADRVGARAHQSLRVDGRWAQLHADQRSRTPTTCPVTRDIRDPKLVEMNGTLFLYAISRLPGAHYRDLVRASVDRCAPSRPTAAAPGPRRSRPTPTSTPAGTETFWGFWRYTKRQYTVAGEQPADAVRHRLQRRRHRRRPVRLRRRRPLGEAVDDHRVVRRRSERSRAAVLRRQQRHGGGAGPPRQSGHPGERPDGDLHVDGAVRDLGVRPPHRAATGRPDLDRARHRWRACAASSSPASTCRARSSAPRSTSCAATWPIPAAPIEVCEIQEVQELRRHGVYLARAARPGPLPACLVQQRGRPGSAVAGGAFLAERHLARRHRLSPGPHGLRAPRPKRACEPPPLPAGTAAFDVSGAHLLTLAPVIWPAQPVFFRPTSSVHGTSLDLTLQPLDRVDQDARWARRGT